MFASLTVPARLIKNGTLVRKPTGKTCYVIQRDIKIYGEGSKIIRPEGDCLFLIGGDSVTCIPESTLVSVDLRNRIELIRFIDELFPTSEDES